MRQDFWKDPGAEKGARNKSGEAGTMTRYPVKDHVCMFSHQTQACPAQKGLDVQPWLYQDPAEGGWHPLKDPRERPLIGWTGTCPVSLSAAKK